MKAIWKGYLKCSLVTIPIKMFTATTRRTPQFHLYHEACGSRISQQNFCPVCGRPLRPEEIVKGYEYGKDRHVVLTEADFQQTREESTDTITILKFVDGGQIPPIYYSEAHYLGPDGGAGAEALAVFRQAMAETGKTAMARGVRLNREYLYNLRPDNGVLVAYTMHYPQEIRPVADLAEAETASAVVISPDNLEMAKTIIGHLSGEFKPEEYRDEYTETLLDIIRAKAAGREVTVEPKATTEKVINLMEALKKSVAATGSGAAPRKKMARAGVQEAAPASKRQRG
jgi:DNA end-binding protein Ku